ncbi:MAG: GIY-YIG nuclease family protein [Actinomycetota bacterium]
MNDLADVSNVATELISSVVEIEIARRLPDEGGLPASPGFYAWWARMNAIEGVPLSPHPNHQQSGLLYVGIAPARATSSQTLRTRVVGNHLSGNLGSSTFRLTLAALLRETLGLHPERRTTKVVLPADENAALSAWQAENLRVSWCVVAQPWLLEPAVIDIMAPPLNLAANGNHPFHATLSEARRSLRGAAVAPRTPGAQG